MYLLVIRHLSRDSSETTYVLRQPSFLSICSLKTELQGKESTNSDTDAVKGHQIRFLGAGASTTCSDNCDDEYHSRN